MGLNSRGLSSYTGSANSITNVIMPAAMSTVTNSFGAVTVGYNNQYNSLLDALMTRKAELAQTVQNNLSQNPDYTGSRNAGVKLAWQYEKADIEMGGKGSANWSYDEKQQILNSGNVRGAHGHHQKNVADHPEHQADPDNIKFYRTEKDHRMQGHNGNYQNESDGPFIDKNKMLARTNNKRVLLNEIKGATISAAIGFGVAFTISAVVELATMGIDAVEVDELVNHSVRAGIEGGITSVAVYGAGRIVSTILQNHGVDLLSTTGGLINYGAVGAVSIVLVSAIQFVKMKRNGVETSEAIAQVGKSALFSTSVLVVSIIAQGIYGGYAGLIVSTSVGLVVLTTNIATSVHKRKIENRIKEYAIEEYKPVYIMG